MDWYTDSAYRQIVKYVNPNVICFTEFFSADWIVNSKFLAKSVLPHSKIEKPLIVQLFWKNPEIFKEAAIIAEGFWVAWIDVNMWCPAKKVVKSGHGSSLMINIDTAYKIIEEMSKAVKIPISVKTRLGFDDDKNLIEFAKWLENAWASLITVHGRTYKQGFGWKADFKPIYELKKYLKIPVLWNWDIQNIDDWMKKMIIDKTNSQFSALKSQFLLDGFMIGRASFGNPWCFLPWNYRPTFKEILKMMERHAKLLVKTKWEKKWCLEIRKHLVQYLHDFEWAKNFRKQLVTVESLDDVKKVLKEIWKILN